MLLDGLQIVAPLALDVQLNVVEPQARRWSFCHLDPKHLIPLAGIGGENRWLFPQEAFNVFGCSAGAVARQGRFQVRESVVLPRLA